MGFSIMVRIKPDCNGLLVRGKWGTGESTKWKKKKPSKVDKLIAEGRSGITG